MSRIRIFTYLLILFCLMTPTQNVYAQSEPDNPYYIVQSGDTLGIIADRFYVSIDELIAVNNIENPNSLAIGTILTIPEPNEITGELILHTLNLGESYQSLSRQNQYNSGLLAQLNELVSPEELYIGSRVVMPVQSNVNSLRLYSIKEAGQTLLETSGINGENPWDYMINNSDILPGEYLTGDMLYLPGTGDDEKSNINIPEVLSLEISPLPFVQGKTIEIKITTAIPMEIQASIGGNPVQIFTTGELNYVALDGIDVESETGITSIDLSGENNGQNVFTLNQRVLVESGYYGDDAPLNVDPNTILPEVIDAEQEQVLAVTTKVNPERYWKDIFQYPLDEPCISADFGGHRIYNNSYEYYHTGIDFNVCTADNTNIYAAAPGYVVFAESTIIRGNAVIIDHGWGVFTGYYHQLNLVVKEGDYVEAGQLLGYIGSTGRSTGYHLHFEVWVNGVQVDPVEWLSTEYP